MMAGPIDRLILVVYRYLHLYAVFVEVASVADAGDVVAAAADKWPTVEIEVQDRFYFLHLNF